MKKTLATLLILLSLVSTMASCDESNSGVSSSSTPSKQEEQSQQSTDATVSDASEEAVSDASAEAVSDASEEAVSDATDNNESSNVVEEKLSYDKILLDARIVHMNPFFLTDTSSYAAKLTGDIISCIDYSYKNDTVQEWVETIYVPCQGYTDAQIADLETSLKQAYAKFEALSCCSAEYKNGNNYFVIEISFKEVDKYENYKALYDMQLSDTLGLISMKKTEENLLSQNYYKK